MKGKCSAFSGVSRSVNYYNLTSVTWIFVVGGGVTFFVNGLGSYHGMKIHHHFARTTGIVGIHLYSAS